MGPLRESGKTTAIRVLKYKNVVVATNLNSGFRIRLKKLAVLTHLILKKLRFAHISLSLVFVSDSQIKHLNQRYLNHSWVTDVLAFPFSDFTRHKSALGNYSFLGEVIISPKRANVYARKLEIPFEEEFMRYICHGILHLKGHSDHSAEEKRKMRRTENQLLSLLGSRIQGII